MEDFTVYGNTYQESLDNINKVLIKCQEMNLSLSHEKCKTLLIEGVFLGHHVSSEGIKVDPANVELIVKLPPPKTQKEVIIFLGHARYYRRFIENSTNIVAPMFGLLTKDVYFLWTDQCHTSFETLKNNDAYDTAIGGVLGKKEDQ
jgi:hypothetical protein